MSTRQGAVPTMKRPRDWGAPRLGRPVPTGRAVDERMGSFGRLGLRRGATIRLCDRVCEGVRRFVCATGFAKGHDDSFVRPGLRRGATIRLGAWVCEGSRRFVCVTGSSKGRDDSIGCLGLRRVATIRIFEGAR
jgi:hypothetical protein